MRVTDAISLGCPLPLIVTIVNSAQTLKVEPPPHSFTSIANVNEALDGLRNGTVTGRVIMKHDWAESKM
jgi:hypothetical protein